MSPPLSAQVFQIMLSLADQDLHGYALIRDIEERTAGEMRLTASTLYGAIKRLLDAGWVEELPVPEDEDARRRIYRLTRAGRVAARAEAARLARLMSDAQRKNLLPNARKA